MTDVKPKVRVIQYQMTVCPETGAAFSITCDVPGDASAADIAQELGILREAGFHEMAAANRRKLRKAEIIKETLTERLNSAKAKGDPLRGSKIRDAIESANADVIVMGVEADADNTLIAEAKALAA